MFVEQIKSEGLAHLSYLIGSSGEAAVIDPRRDCEVYALMAAERGCRITHVFETHRNEDLLSGAAALSALTGAAVHHGPNPAGDVVYASTVHDGDDFRMGNVRLQVLETPGHTDDSVSYVAYDAESGEDPVAVFTGDALFVGDVGRTDFYPDRAREVAGCLFDSLRKLEALGDQTIVYPAHGAGSVCGSGMADREVSTIGLERVSNDRFAMRDRDSFIDAKLAEEHDQPPYFRAMEAGNLAGASQLTYPLLPTPLSVTCFKDRAADAQLVDVRSAAAFFGAHLPGSLALPMPSIAAFAGWLLEPGRSIVLVAEDVEQAEEAARRLGRIGYDNIEGFFRGSLVEWAAAGEAFESLAAIDAEGVKSRLDEPQDWTLLDVRSHEEYREISIPGAEHIYLGELAEKLNSLDPQRSHTVMCGSGARATIGASVLLREGFENVDLFLGSLAAWQKTGLPVK